MSGNIFNSKGARVGVVDGATIFRLNGQELYHLNGINIYRLSGELVGHLTGRTAPISGSIVPLTSYSPSEAVLKTLPNSEKA